LTAIANARNNAAASRIAPSQPCTAKLMIRPSARSNAATCRILRVCRNVMVSSLAALRSFPSCYDPGDPGAVDLLHGEQVVGDAYLVAGLWGASEVTEDEATHSPEVLALEP
jgi:hypothetical protein